MIMLTHPSGYFSRECRVGTLLNATTAQRVAPLFVAKSQRRRACEVCVGLTPVSGVVACYRPSQHTDMTEISQPISSVCLGSSDFRPLRGQLVSFNP